MNKDLSRLTRLVLKSIDKRIPSYERGLWHRQADFTARRIEETELKETIRRIRGNKSENIS